MPALRSTDYINTIPPEREPWFPGDEEIERRIRAFIRWNAAVMVSSANRKGLEVGGHIATYQSSASLYEVGFNHFFRGKDHPGGGDQIYIQGHASPGIYARAFLEGRLDRGAALRASARRSSTASGKGLPSYPHPRLMPDFWEFPTVSMGLTAHQLDLPGAVQPLPAEPRHQGHQPSSTCGRSSATARWPSPSRSARSASPPARSSTTSPWSSTATCSSSTARSRGNGKIIQELEVELPRRRLERHQGRLGPRVGRAARPRRRRRPGQPDEHHPRRPVPDLLGRGRRLHPRALLRRRPAAAQDGRAHDRRPDREAAARRPRLPQGVRRLRRRHQARRPADRDPGQDHQGLDDRRPRGQERHPPDEEADQGRPQEVPRPALPADQRPRPRARPTRRPAPRRSSTPARTPPRSST